MGTRSQDPVHDEAEGGIGQVGVRVDGLPLVDGQPAPKVGAHAVKRLPGGVHEPPLPYAIFLFHVICKLL
jgi:hypothetical protein